MLQTASARRMAKAHLNATIIPMDIAIVIFELVVLLFSAILHEIAHGYMAERLGDDTARRAGRLTLNPIVHLDPFGSILMPLLLLWATSGQFFFAAAKPVPYNPNNLRDPRSGSAKIALAGPATNFGLALVFGIIVRVLVWVPALATNATVSTLAGLLAIVVYVNVILGIFNLVPIPPLDGSRILFAALPQTRTTFRVFYTLERWGLLIVLLFVLFGFQILIPFIQFVFTLFTGQSFGM
jgi:Zn-dependent protease